jgi:hypothetical protein
VIKTHVEGNEDLQVPHPLPIVVQGCVQRSGPILKWEPLLVPRTAADRRRNQKARSPSERKYGPGYGPLHSQPQEALS